MVQLRTAVPEDETAAECEYCARPLPTAERLALHKGVEHFGRLDEPEREAFESARAAERDELARFRLKALGVLVVLYFGFLFLYVLFT